MALETLAQAIARLEDEMQNRKGEERVWLYTARIENIGLYQSISDAVDVMANDLGFYIGEKRFIKHDDYAEIRVGFAPSAEIYDKHFKGK